MKTNSSTAWLRSFRLTVVCLAIAALVSFDLWAGGYCYRNRSNACMSQTGTPLASQCSPTPSVVFPSF